MREAMLIVHFLGLTMGLGTSFGYMFLGIASSKMERNQAKTFTMNTFALSRMGHIGTVMLVVSGLYLITPYWPTLSSRPLLIAKLSLVLVLIVLIVLLDRASKKAKNGDFETQMKKIQMLGRFSLLTAISIVILAVLNFR